jgi:chloramphenicol-sensitive protein RarD
MNPGAVYAVLAFGLWGLYPLYFRELASVHPLEVVLHRVAWSLLLLLVVLASLRRLGWMRGALAQPRLVAGFALSSVLLSVNWLLYVWAVQAGRVIDASLGYFINPLVSVGLGYVVLHERLRRAQWLAVALAAAGVVWLTVEARALPWIALTLAFSFGVYGLMRKLAPLGAIEGLTMETLLVSLVAVPTLAIWTLRGTSAAAQADVPLLGWLALSGPMTTAPLLLFAAAARRLTLATLGLTQYLAPTLQFLLGVWVFREPFSGSRFVGFAIIWAALALYTAEGWWFSRQPAPARSRRPPPRCDRCRATAASSGLPASAGRSATSRRSGTCRRSTRPKRTTRTSPC